MRCPVHLSIGQEAVAVGACAALEPDDWAMSGHRSHGHYLAKGGNLPAMLAELYGKATGCTGGKGGSMHLLDLDAGFVGAVPIVASTIPMAAGAAWASKLHGSERVVMSFFGEAATEEGAFHEALNFAAVWKLPVIFVCENNQYMEYTPIRSVTAVDHPAADRASAYGLERQVVDGNDADAVYAAAAAAIGRARGGEGPSLIEAMTYRYSGHSRADPAKYRPAGELEEWMKRDPIALYRARLIELGVPESALRDMEGAVQRAVDEATEAAKASAPSSVDVIDRDVWADGGSSWRN